VSQKNRKSAVLDDAGTVDVITEVRRQEALLKTGALQNAILNSANFSSIATDEKGVIQIFNVGAERMLGYTAAEVMNKITPADISDPQEVIARAKALSVELGTPITPGFEALVFKASRGIEDIYELTYFRKDGSRFPAVVSVTALRDAQDAIIGYLLIGTDNTARKQAEEALLKAGALQSAIFNSANFSSIATDAKGVIQIFNVGAERMLGYTAAEVMNKITPADISDPQEVIARAKALSVELGTPITPGFEALVFKASRGIEDIYELTYFRKDGSRFPAVVSVTALRDAQDAIIGYLLIGTDNTARKQVEEERRKLDQRLRDQQFYTRSLIESNIDALMTTDPSGIITDVNKQMEALTGCTRDELIGAPFKNYFTDPERAEAAIKLVLSEIQEWLPGGNGCLQCLPLRLIPACHLDTACISHQGVDPDSEHLQDRAGNLGEVPVLVLLPVPVGGQFGQAAIAGFAFAQFGGPFLHRLFQHLVVILEFFVQQPHFQHVVDACLDFDQIERLADEILCAGLQRAQLVARLGGDHQDRKVAVRIVGLEAFHHLESIHAGHLQVEQDQVVAVFAMQRADLLWIHR